MGLLDHDDLLAPKTPCMKWADRIVADEQTDVLYTDEDKVTTDLKEHFQPHFKPDFSIDLLRSNNYICHFFVVRRTLLEKTGGISPEFDGAQDMILSSAVRKRQKRSFIYRRCCITGERTKSPRRITASARCMPLKPGNGPSKVIWSAAGNRVWSATRRIWDFYRVDYPVQGSPLVSVVIPNKDHSDMLMRCVNSIKEKTTWKNL